MSFRIDVKRKKGERFETLLRRFNTRVIRSKKILDARKYRFRSKPLRKQQLQEAALRKLANRKKYDWLRKTGQIEERPRGNRRR